MPTVKTIDLGVFCEGSTDRIQLTLKKDGAAWAGVDSVTLRFENPDRETRFDRPMTVSDDAGGVWYYDTADDELSAGYWTVGVKVVDGPVVKWYPYEISFLVTEQP